ncbi:MAG: hydrogenase maturation protease [Saprospiraceae bacterium]
MDSDKILVLGIGNYLMGDEGVGVHFANYLLSQDLPKNVDVLDGGTGGFYLTNYIESYPIVILIDATLDDKTSGSTRLWNLIFKRLSKKLVHDIGMKDLIEAMIFMGTLPKIYLLQCPSIRFNSSKSQLSRNWKQPA